jgi:hypothetical protein
VLMLRARSVLLIIFLLAGSLSPPLLRAQGTEGTRLQTPGPAPPRVILEQSYPATIDPQHPEAWIPFTLTPELFEGKNRVPVTIRIFNSLNRQMAIPEAIDHPAGPGTKVFNLAYTEPGKKLAYWDFNDLSGRRVPSGIYYVQLVVGDEIPPISRLILANPAGRRRTIIPW